MYGLNDDEKIKYRELSALSTSKISKDEASEKAQLEQKSEDTFLEHFVSYLQQVQDELEKLPVVSAEKVDELLANSTALSIAHSPSLQEIRGLLFESSSKQSRLNSLAMDLNRVSDTYVGYIEAMESFILAYAPVSAEWRAKGFVGTLCAEEKLELARVSALLRSVNTMVSILKEQHDTLSRAVTIYQEEIKMHELPPSAKQAFEQSVESVPKIDNFDELLKEEQDG